MNYAIVANGIVENVIVWDGHAEYAPSGGAAAVTIPANTIVNIGYHYDGTNFTAS